MSARVLLAAEWMLATTLAVVLAQLAVEIVGAALLGWTLVLLLPIVGGVVGGLSVGVCQWIVLRRHMHASRLWIVFTLLGFVGAWILAVILVAVMFVPPSGVDKLTAFLSFALPTPIIGLSQSIVLRRWTDRTRLWVFASTAGWAAFMAVEIFHSQALSEVNPVAGRLVSSIAGYLVASTIGATLLGGALAGAITGVALAITLRHSPDPRSFGSGQQDRRFGANSPG